MRAADYEGKKDTKGWRQRKAAFLEQDLVDGDRAMALYLTDNATMREWKPGDVIYNEGEQLELLFFCFYGSVKLVGFGKEFPRKAGQSFGSWPYSDPKHCQAYEVTATAREQSVVAQVEYSALKRMPQKQRELLLQRMGNKDRRHLHEHNRETEIPEQSLMPNVFISYARADRPVAQELAIDLGQRALNVWWDDSLRAGEDYHDAIMEALEASKAVIVIWSPNAYKSEWVRDEAARAKDAKKLVPTYIPPFSLKNIPGGFGQQQCVEVTNRSEIYRALSHLGLQLPNVPPAGPTQTGSYNTTVRRRTKRVISARGSSGWFSQQDADVKLLPSAAAQPGYRLVGKMRAKLREAILAGFDKAALDEILRDNDMFSHNVAIGPDFSTCVNSLIDVAHQEGWLIELCSVLAAARSGNAPVSSAILAVRQSLTG